MYNSLSIDDLLWFLKKPFEVRGIRNDGTQFTLTLKVYTGCSMFQCQPWSRQNIVKHFMTGRQQNPEHGTFRNIPEQGKLSQNKWKKVIKNSDSQ